MKRITVMLVACLLISSAVPGTVAAESGTAPVPDMEYRFFEYGTNGDYIADNTKNIMVSYNIGAINWRYEAASSEYQFRVSGKHPNVTSDGKNIFVNNAIQFLGSKDWWYALRLRAPGTGKFALTLTKSREAKIEVCFLSATAMEKALGSNAAAYAQIMCEEPYLAGSTEAFQKYKKVIEDMLAETTPSIPAVTEDVKQMTGECSFSTNDEYIMVIKFINETSLRTQLQKLSATWIGEAENIPGGNLMDNDKGFDVKRIFIPVAVVAVSGGVIFAIIKSRKKTSKKTEE